MGTAPPAPRIGESIALAPLLQLANVAPSRLHSKFVLPSVAWKVKVAVVLVVLAGGALSMTVSGAVVSIDQV